MPMNADRKLHAKKPYPTPRGRVQLPDFRVMRTLKRLNPRAEDSATHNPYESKVRTLYFVVGVLLVFLFLVGVCIRVWFPNVEFEPAAFLTEYLKFLATLVTVVVGWALVHILWETLEKARKSSELRSSLLETLDRLKRLNTETMELIDSNSTGKTLEEREKYVEANINRQRDLVHTLDLIRDHYYLINASDVHFESKLSRFLAEIKHDFSVIEKKPYDRLRNIDETTKKSLMQIGKACHAISSTFLAGRRCLYRLAHARPVPAHASASSRRAGPGTLSAPRT